MFKVYRSGLNVEHMLTREKGGCTKLLMKHKEGYEVSENKPTANVVANTEL